MTVSTPALMSSIVTTTFPRSFRCAPLASMHGHERSARPPMLFHANLLPTGRAAGNIPVPTNGRHTVWAAHVESDVLRVSRVVGIELALLLGMHGDEVDGVTAGPTVSAAATMLEVRRCAEEMGICQAARARPPSA